MLKFGLCKAGISSLKLDGEIDAKTNARAVGAEKSSKPGKTRTEGKRGLSRQARKGGERGGVCTRERLLIFSYTSSPRKIKLSRE